MHSDRYTIIFALLVCVSCSVLLAFAAGVLRPKIEQNMAFDVQKNILMATGLVDDPKSSSKEEMTKLYKDNILGIVIDTQGELIQDKVPSDLTDKSEYLALYLRKSNTKVDAYCIPVSGKGLWSTIYGYLALESDGKTIRGVTFYKHGETPGLGGEIERKWFLDNFKGKKIFNDQSELTPIRVFKGKVPEGLAAAKKAYTVDGISGATLTGNGINLFLEKNLQMYEAYLCRVHAGNAQS